MRRSLLRGSKAVIDREPDILVKSYSPNQSIQYLSLTGTDVVIKEEVTGNILWSCVGEGTLDYWTTLPLSATDVDIRITAKKLKKISFASSISDVKYFRVNNGCNIADCFANCGWLKTVSGMNIDNIKDASRLFYNCQSLESVEPFSLKEKAVFKEAFYLCTKITTCPVINIDTASNLFNCFLASGLNNLSNIQGKALQATDVTSIFAGTKLTEVINLNFEKATNVSLDGMATATLISNITAPLATNLSFYNNPLVTTIVDINAPLVTQIIFSGDSSLETVNNFSIHPNGLTDGTQMFSGCSSLTFVPAFNYSRIQHATAMFANCTLLSNFDNLQITTLTHVDSMFSGCQAMVYIPHLDYSSVITANNMFSNCIGLIGEASISFGSLQYASFLFASCTNITRSYVGCRYTNNVNMDNLFANCTNLEHAEVYVLYSTNLVLSLYSAFINCRKLTSAVLPPNPASCNYQSTFENCELLGSIPNGLGNIGDFRKTFYNCKSLTSIDNMTFRTMVTSTYSQQFATLDNTFSVSGLTSATNLTFICGVNQGGYLDTMFTIANMFNNCESLSTVSNIKIVVAGKTNVVYTIGQQFEGCPLITSLVPITVEIEAVDLSRNLRTSNLLRYNGIVNYNDDASILPYTSILEFNSLPLLKTVELTLNCSSIDNKVEFAGFSNCPELESIVIHNPHNYDLTNLYVYNGSWGYVADFLQNVPKLTNLVITGLKQHIAIPESVISTSVLEGIVNGVSDNTGNYPLQVIMGTTRKNQLSQAVIDGATAKNWEVV